MITFDFVQGSDIRLNKKLNNLVASQIPWASVLSLNDTGKALVGRNKTNMKKRFNKPVPYTLNAFYFTRASKKNLSITFQRKEKPSGKHYLEVQEKGGLRPRKGVETSLNFKIPYSGDIQALLPTHRTKGSGNDIKMSEVNKVIAGLRNKNPQPLFKDTKSKKTGKTTRRYTTRYWIGYKEETGHKTDGIYRTVGKGQRLEKMFHILERRVKYQPRLKFYEGTKAFATRHFKSKMKKNLVKALITSGFR